MKHLILIRHAKSSWTTPLNDIDRPLMNRGIQDAHLVSTYVKNDTPNSYLIWSSTAKRALETAIIFAQNWAYPIENIVFKNELYTFDERTLEQIIKLCPDDCHHLIVFGHNEAITNFVNKFGHLYIDNVPTSGFVALQFEVDSWENISKGQTIKTFFPRDSK